MGGHRGGGRGPAVIRAREAAAKKAAATAGAASSTSTKKVKTDPPALTTNQIQILTNESVSNKGHITNDPPPIYKPYVAPGVRGVPGKTLYVGNLSPDKVQQPKNKYRFTFHWNPAEIDIDTSTSYIASVAPKATYTDGARNLFVTTTAYSFQFMIERQDEVAVATLDPTDPRGLLGSHIRLQYGSNTFNGIRAKNFAEVGTLYDLEFLYLAINGAQRQSALGPRSSPAISAPYILANPVYLTFGKASQFYGYVTDLNINHMMFTPAMVPTVTYVQLALNAYALNNVYADQAAVRKLNKTSPQISKNAAQTTGQTTLKN